MSLALDHASSPAQRLAHARKLLQALGAQALVVPSSDPHLSEYLPERWNTRAWISGFTGSAGVAVITADAAGVLTDSRYWTQAAAQLAGSGFELVRAEQGSTLDVARWLNSHLAQGATVIVDGQVLSLSAWQTLQFELTTHGIALRGDIDAFDSLWADRPGLPQAPVWRHSPPYATVSVEDRLATLRAQMAAEGATHLWLATLDDIAWLLNLRGSDVDYNPVFVAHALVDAREVRLFIEPGKVEPALAAALAESAIWLHDYPQIAPALAGLPHDAVLMLDPARVTHGLRQQVPAHVKVREQLCPVMMAKACKTPQELAHVRQAMEHDGAAMAAFYARFEAALAAGQTVTELTVDEWLSAERARQPGFVSLSFSTIAGWNANGALPHYRALPEAHATISGNGLLLIDSGGQYLGGTTDITRVWAIGMPSSEHKRDCTRVLQGMIALSRTVYPVGTPGPMLDAIARAPLWAEGLDFGHGTGHGVGYCLNVHEPPQRISKALPRPETALREGMITSIEPGVYREGHWGVRFENLVASVPFATHERGTFGEMLAFETLTLCPIDTRCLEAALMRPDEIDWLNAYHAEVWRRVSPHVQGAARDWLQARTRPWMS
ncbi:aminopeptidase P family protein [Amphibiibacter pelophylacis]|uniref:Aminopeptidase P family protein n=1 Tax=Amphibiibacter pelophylacis TaxID=1799477 RepID=A0ACC6P3M3_9BURK